MNANPHTCPHLNLIYEKVAGGVPFIRCDDCYTTWDADEPITDTIRIAGTPYANSPIHDHLGRTSYDHGDENDTYENHPEWWEDDTPLNPDNEPTSEHMQYKDDDNVG